MIRWVEACPEMTDDRLTAYRIRALWECYGAVPFIRFYSGENGSAAAIFDGQAIACIGDSDVEEWAWFLSMQPDVASVLADEETAEAVAAAWKTEAKRYPVMRYSAETAVTDGAEDASPRELYAFLQPIFPGLAPFDTWYPDVCYRNRHGFCRNAVVREGDAVVSSAMTTAEWSGGALIGGVATAPTHRRQGLAGACVRALVGTLTKEGRQVYICPKNDGAMRLYTALGFAVCDEIAQVERI